ncbi:hypothetical protein C8F04DRAFT_1360387 [Mycena alexandri]|uniref:Uncharacterized protein n=1 Tax=Mycena alexandri TaxID=1745969 RepID=A0AAD6SQD1_9AGAR|nr:hypothetical protein C8F04DRAFT_1360387 [Mycena alexandri]
MFTDHYNTAIFCHILPYSAAILPCHSATLPGSSSQNLFCPPHYSYTAAGSKSSPASHSSGGVSFGLASTSLSPSPSPPSAVAESNSSETSTAIHDVAVKPNSKSRLLAEIITPVLLAVIAAGGIVFVVCRRRYKHALDIKDWEESRLPELEGTGTSRIWSFAGVRGVMKDTSPRARSPAYEGGADWNRSDTHLRGEPDWERDQQNLAIAESGPDTDIHHRQSVPASTIDASERKPSDVGHDFAQAFHSESSMHDEPALVDSRPGTLLQPFPLPPLPEYSP